MSICYMFIISYILFSEHLETYLLRSFYVTRFDLYTQKGGWIKFTNFPVNT